MRAIHRGVRSQGAASIFATILACFLGVIPKANADTASTTIPDAPAPPVTRKVSAASFPPSWDLDGIYLWLGPSGAASHVDGAWDSTIGADLSIVRVREQASLGVVGGSLGASRWTERGGGRVWLDAVVGTQLAGRMFGATLGPILELGDVQHPRLGGSIGIWAFVGVTPYARLGLVQELGTFVEIGVHLALPVWRH